MAKPGFKAQRIHPDFAKAMKDIAQFRVMKGLSKPLPKEISFSEQTRLLMKTDGWKQSCEELKTKPKKYDF